MQLNTHTPYLCRTKNITIFPQILTHFLIMLTCLMSFPQLSLKRSLSLFDERTFTTSYCHSLVEIRTCGNSSLIFLEMITGLMVYFLLSTQYRYNYHHYNDDRVGIPTLLILISNIIVNSP